MLKRISVALLLLLLILGFMPSIVFLSCDLGTQDRFLVWYFSDRNEVLKDELIGCSIDKILDNLGLEGPKFRGFYSYSTEDVGPSMNDGTLCFPLEGIRVESNRETDKRTLLIELRRLRYLHLSELTKDEILSLRASGLELCDNERGVYEVIGEVELDILDGRISTKFCPCKKLGHKIPLFLLPFDRSYTRTRLD